MRLEHGLPSDIVPPVMPERKLPPRVRPLERGLPASAAPAGTERPSPVEDLALFRALIQNATDIIYIVDGGGIIRYVGPTLERIMGADPEQLIGRSLFELVHPDDASQMLGRFSRLTVQFDQSETFEYRARHRDGTWRSFEARARNLLREAAVGGILITARDVTARCRAEEAQRRLTAVLEATTDFVGTTDPNGQLLYVNQEGRRILGLDAVSPLPSLTIHDLHPGWATDILLREGIPTAIRQGVWTGETALLGEQGAIPVSQVLIAHTAANGHPEYFSMVMRDISAHKSAESALRMSEERFRRVVDSMDDMVFTVDREHVHTALYGRWLERYGLDPSLFLGRTASEVLGAEAGTVHRQGNERALAGESVVFDWTMQKDGRQIDVQSSLSPLRDAGGAVIGVVGVARDMTERRHLEEQLRQSQKMEAVGRLAGGIAHDFNNLLTAIQGHTELLIDDLAQAPLVRQELTEIHTAASRAASLTRQLLAFSRRQVLQPRVLDLNANVVGIEKMLRRLIGEDVELVTSLQKDLASVLADPGQIEQVLLNLAVNARDAMPLGGRLMIQTRTVAATETEDPQGPSAWVLLEVSDDGVGMSEEVKLRIFEPFYTTKEQGKGTGLGLSTVYGIVAQSGGRIEVESEPGRGTTFGVYLPAAQASSIEQADPARKRVPNGSETVLIVEDEPAVRSLVRRILKRKGYCVFEASCAEEALRVAADADEEIHLLLTDVVMPGMNGSQIAEVLLAQRPTLRVLYMSGYSDAIFRHGGPRSEFALLEKPFSSEMLATKVREVLDNPRGALPRPKRTQA